MQINFEDFKQELKLTATTYKLASVVPETIKSLRKTPHGVTKNLAYEALMSRKTNILSDIARTSSPNNLNLTDV